jgi:hypothetical protein
MGKNILVVYFSQTGQLKQILDQIVGPMAKSGHQVEFLEVRPVHSFPFPWALTDFFDTVPDAVKGVPTALQPWQTLRERYDLVVLGWQPWHLSPSIPISSMLQDEKFKSLIRDTPVVMVSGCRNMWINAMEQNKKLLKGAGARLSGHIALVDRNPNHLSYVTIFHWMGTGRKDRKWGIFPRPGVSEADILNAVNFGITVDKHLIDGTWDLLQPELVAVKAVEVKYSLMFIERKAGKIFRKWVAIMDRFPKRKKQILVAYQYYLAIALLVASPVILFVDFIFFRPFLQKRIKKQKDYYLSVALK